MSGVCYETVALAQDAYFSGLPVQSSLTASGVLLTTQHVKDANSVWNIKQVSTDTVGVQTVVYQVVVSPPSFPACYSPFESFSDGVTIGWAVAAMLVVILFVRVCKQIMASYV
ncbi:MAG: hypothetical protein PHD65_05450 [Gallionella sp.]|nr:hypothetical protein [Gallionella sp.]